jgi:phytoene synthase
LRAADDIAVGTIPPGAALAAASAGGSEATALALVQNAPPTGVVRQAVGVLQQHARTFSLASIFLNASQRDDAAVLYALCREVDDAVDEARSFAEGQRALDALEAELRGEAPARPLVAAFLALCRRLDAPVGAALELVRGVRGDLAQVQVQDDAELLQYAYRVAGTVGLMMCSVVGVRDPKAAPFAIDLGIAMQISNICRDVAEDAARGRVYLPASRLLAHGIEPRAVLSRQVPGSALAPVVADLLALADRYYASADRGLRFIPFRPRLAVVAASRIYRAIGAAIARRRHNVWSGRAVVSPLAKAGWLVLSVIRGAIPPRFRRHHNELHESLRGLPGASSEESA